MRKLRRHDDFFEPEFDDFILEEPKKKEFKEPDNWTIITALNRVLDQARGSELSEDFWESCKNPLAFLTQELGLTNIQVVVLAILVESGETLSWRSLGQFLRCSRLSVMVYSDEIEELVDKRWLTKRGAHEMGGWFEGFALMPGVITALRHNQTFVPEKIDGLQIQEFVDLLECHISKNMNDNSASFKDDEEWMLQLCKANPHLPLCHEVLGLKEDIHVQSLLMMVVFDYAQWAGSNDEGLSMSTIDQLYPNDFRTNGMRKKLRNGSHPLMRCGFIEHRCDDGIANTEKYMLTSKGKQELLNGYTPSQTKCPPRSRTNRNLKSHSMIKEKTMFYNAQEQEQIERLTNILHTSSLPFIQERLEKEGMRKGFPCLFYGAPGTGKTETVLQIARQTGRDIMQIDIAGMRDKFVGESEKNIKAVFLRYREACKHCEVMPILFFNEADGIFGKRTTNNVSNPTVAKMENAIQNIILQEMEDLDGILIATTNLTCNLDDAFERRFLFKVEFQKPDTEVKAKLWRSMLGDDITEEESHYLAKRFDFSGGQIENIARKRTIEYILSGKRPTVKDIEAFCQNELLDKKTVRRAIGFTQ